MRNAQTTKQVTIDEAIRLIEGIRRSNLVMRPSKSSQSAASTVILKCLSAQ